MPRIQISKELYAKLADEAKYRGMSLEEFLLWLYCQVPRVKRRCRLKS